MVRRSARILRQSFGTVCSAAFRRRALTLLNTGSIGLRAARGRAEARCGGEPIKDWSLTSLKEKWIKIGAEVVSQGRYIPREILIAELRSQPLPAPA